MPFLTKSLYLDGRVCARRAWMGAYRSQFAKAPTESELARMREGREIGKLAQRMFPGGFDCRIPGTDEENAAHSLWRLGQPGDVFYEPSFEANGLFVRCDILLREESGWRLIEVKSGGSVKTEHYEDAAYQVMVLESAGFHVSAVEIMHVSRTWWSGDDPSKFFIRQDVSDQVVRILERTRDHAARLRQALELESPPEEQLNTFCKECVFLTACHGQPDRNDIVFLPLIRRDMVSRLRGMGVNQIAEIPESVKLNERQARVRDSVIFSRSIVDPTLVSRLDEIKFPAAFIDFEACMWAQPPFPGMRAYENVPFQWSMHLMHENGSIEHKAYLSEGACDPRVEFAETLHAHVKDAASIVFYSGYEIQCAKELERGEIPMGRELRILLEDRGVDLLKIVQDCVYLPSFGGSFSIKSVLPALVPDLSYKSLAVQNGDMAVFEFKRLTSEALTPDRHKEIMDNLYAYCELDTMAMVRIYRELVKLSEATATTF